MRILPTKSGWLLLIALTVMGGLFSSYLRQERINQNAELSEAYYLGVYDSCVVTSHNIKVGLTGTYRESDHVDVTTWCQKLLGYAKDADAFGNAGNAAKFLNPARSQDG
jgi:hypothetical protein